MLTDDWIEEIYENRVKVGIFPRLMMKELIDEIKRLRAERDEFIRELSDLRGIVIDLSHELARYKTPQVENATFHMQGQIFNPRTMRWDVIFSHKTQNVDNVTIKEIEK